MQEVRAAILKKLYDSAREKPDAWLRFEELQEEFGLDYDALLFHLKYLDEKGFIKLERFIGGGGIAKISALGIDAVESPEMFVAQAPFLQQIVIHGDVVNSAIMQAESIKIRNGLSNLLKNVEGPEVEKLLQEILSESYREEPDAGKIKRLMDALKQKAPEVASAAKPYVLKLLERWLGF